MAKEAFGIVGASTSIAATTTSASTAIPGAADNIGGQSLMVTNTGTTPVFVKWGVGAQTATVTDVPVGAGQVLTFALPRDATQVAAIYGTGTGTVYFQRGTGTP